jgi:hypothetical protein
MMFITHIFDHALYNRPALLYRGSEIDIDHAVRFCACLAA